NTDIWYYPNDDATHAKYPNAPDEYFVPENTIVELSGKIYFEEAGKYRMYLRGRMNCAVYYSTDGGKTYGYSATIKDTSPINGSANFRPGVAATYVDIEMEEDSWLYFKSVLIVQPTPMVSYIGLGMSKWTEPIFTMVEKYYDADGNEVSSSEDENFAYSETHYYDYQGQKVEEDVVNNAELIPPAADAKPSYVNAYRLDYEFPSNSGFETDYFYERTYRYTYNGDEKFLTPNQTLVESKYQPWDNTPTHAIGNLFDGNDRTFIHSNRTPISETNPFMVTVKLDAPVTASRMTFYGSSVSANYATYLPKTFKIWVSDDGNNWTLVSDVASSTASNLKVVANFDDFHTFSYYKVEITQTHARNNLGYICLSKIELSSLLTLSNGNLFSPDKEAFSFNGNWSSVSANSTFGHVFVGETNSTMSFKFNGTRLVLLSSMLYDNSFEVIIDGKKIDSVELKNDNAAYGVSYISDKLACGTHTVVIKCLKKASIDSVVIYS
ncbi:MAG: discoidin domain-containing protein, partial [Clostridia bacterium]|nr:discoidin domain-containing protein [Clostridia bacterium]